MVNIFCSHSSKDASWIAPLKNVVESVGHSIYLFEDDQRPGEYVPQKLQQAIERADVMLVFLTPNSERSNYVHQEIGYALRDRKPIIPLVEVGVSSEVLALLEGREYIPFDRSNNPDTPSPEVYAALLGRLHKYAVDKRVENVLAFILFAAVCLGLMYLVGPLVVPELFTRNT